MKPASRKTTLKKYREKRNFDKTPEPAGSARPKVGAQKNSHPLFFCVQKHLASRLHYDFRLEHRGVLLSWAVPKGPSLKPADKRLAMRVEDHPVEYGEFEGVIPEGYGAGIVMLWDRGTWTPEIESIDAALEKGELKFKLNGYKLKGSWVLIRTGRTGRMGRTEADGESKSWLLIKHRDEWSGDVDITAFAPRSIKSDCDFEHILARENPDVWKAQRESGGKPMNRQLEEIIAKAAVLKNTKATQVSPKRRAR